MENIEEIVIEITKLIGEEDKELLKEYLDNLNISEVENLIDEIPEQAPLFIETLSINRAVNVFRILDFPTQERIIKKLSGSKIKELINELPPDDRTSFFSELHGDVVKKMIILISPEDRKEALMLLGYPEDSIGRLMTPDYITIKKDYNVKQALEHIRKYGKNSETIDVVYIIDKDGTLLDDIRIRELLLSPLDKKIVDLMDDRLISLNAMDKQEIAVNVFRMNNRVALPVVDDKDIMLGIVTIDDILWVANEESTEDIQRIGGTAALDEPYLDMPLLKLVGKRAGWLIILFIGELLTASVMQYYENQLASMVVLAMFLPLMISSGGNSGSQASTLIIRAMALGEVNLIDWWRVMRREFISGSILGILLGAIGFCRIYIWHLIFPNLYGENWFLVGLTVSFSLIGIVLWGSLVGSMLPFILRKFKADPATSSAPFVATLVDVTGLIIYLSIASIIFGELIN